jgi:hypothetical protein
MIHHPLQTSLFAVDYILPAQPAAGDPALYAVPTNTRIQVLSASFRIACNATAIARLPYIAIDHGGIHIQWAVAPGIVGPSETVRLHFNNATTPTDFTPTQMYMFGRLPANYFLEAGEILTATAIGLQAGDLIDEWLLRAKIWITD